MKTLILGLGNTILRDDGIGIYVARSLRARVGDAADVKEAELAGLDLIELLKDYERAYIIDAIQLDGEEPGTVFRMRTNDLRITPRLASFHDIDLVTALELGRRLELPMPREVVIFGVQVADALSLGESCTPSVERVIEPLCAEIAGEITQAPCPRISIPLSERRSGRA